MKYYLVEQQPVLIDIDGEKPNGKGWSDVVPSESFKDLFTRNFIFNKDFLDRILQDIELYNFEFYTKKDGWRYWTTDPIVEDNQVLIGMKVIVSRSSEYEFNKLLK